MGVLTQYAEVSDEPVGLDGEQVVLYVRDIFLVRKSLAMRPWNSRNAQPRFAEQLPRWRRSVEARTSMWPPATNHAGAAPGRKRACRVVGADGQDCAGKSCGHSGH
jgi:hypothetical protein